MPNKKTTLSFEAALRRVEEITRRLENDQTPLDEAVALYKEGIDLAAFCEDSLSGYEKQVALLQKNDGEITLRPFDGAARPVRATGGEPGEEHEA